MNISTRGAALEQCLNSAYWSEHKQISALCQCPRCTSVPHCDVVRWAFPSFSVATFFSFFVVFKHKDKQKGGVMLRFKFTAEILFIHHFLCEDLHKQYIQIPEHQESWEKTNPCETWLYSKLTDVPWPKGYLFSRDLCHVSRCSEHVRFTGASIEAKVISAAGVFREYFVTG